MGVDGRGTAALLRVQPRRGHLRAWLGLALALTLALALALAPSPNPNQTPLAAACYSADLDLARMLLS